MRVERYINLLLEEVIRSQVNTTSIKQHNSRFCCVLLHLPLKVQIPIEYNFQLKVTLSSCLIRSSRQCLSSSTTANLAHDETAMPY